MSFHNRSEHQIEVRWLNFDGNEVSYGFIEPGGRNLVYTYLTHPWVFRRVDKPEELLAVRGKPVAWPTQKDAFADVEEAPFLSWNTATHASAFRSAAPAFARDVQNFLMAYHAQRKANGRSCDVAGRRGGATGKTRRSSTGGALDLETDPSPTKAAIHCCGVQLWHWRGLEGCNAAHAAPSHHSPNTPAPGCRSAGGGVASFAPLSPPTSTPSAPSTPNSTASAASHHQRHHPPHHTHPASPRQGQAQPEDGLLGQLPYDIILEIIAKMAPKLRDYEPVLKDDMEIMPFGVAPATGPVALLAARLLGPAPPPAPTAAPEAWFAAVNAGAMAGAPHILGEIGALVVQQQDGPLAPPAAVPPPPPQQPQQGAADQAGAAAVELPPQVLEIMQYTEAAILANTALTHATRMALHQGAEGPALQQLVSAHNMALRNAAAAATGSQEQQGEAAGGGEGGQALVQGGEEQEEEDDGSEYGDADEAVDLDAQQDGGDEGLADGVEEAEASSSAGGDAMDDDEEEEDDERFEDVGDAWTGPSWQGA